MGNDLGNEKRKIWQIAAGPSSRSYADSFLKYGVGLIGPGDPGTWSHNRNDDDFRDEQGASGGFVRRFATEVNIGDVFLLRIGISKVCGLGLVASDYIYLNQFDDVNGWDLQHGRRVRWCVLPQEYDFGEPVFGANPTRLSRIWNEKVIEYAERFLNSPPSQWQTAQLPELPAEEPLLESIPSYLKDIIAEVHDLAPILWDRKNFGDHPMEDELIAHFVIPFFRCLGWPPELIAVKWRKIDISIFRSLPRIPENCHFIVEAKRLGGGVEGALGQAREYSEALGELCDIIVTDGIRYRLYSGKENLTPVAYANLIRLKRSSVELFDKLKRT